MVPLLVASLTVHLAGTGGTMVVVMMMAMRREREKGGVKGEKGKSGA